LLASQYQHESIIKGRIIKTGSCYEKPSSSVCRALRCRRAVPPAPLCADAGPAGPDSTSRAAGGVPTDAERWRQFRKEFVSWEIAVGNVATGSISHLRDEPPSWRGDGWGYGARVLSGAGSSLVYLSIEHSLSAILNADIRRYRPIEKGGFFWRTGHALRASVTVRTAGGGSLPDVPQIGGVAVSSLARSQWETGGLKSGGAVSAVAITMGF